jgi:hypothetical protein
VLPSAEIERRIDELLFEPLRALVVGAFVCGLSMRDVGGGRNTSDR